MSHDYEHAVSEMSPFAVIGANPEMTFLRIGGMGCDL